MSNSIARRVQDNIKSMQRRVADYKRRRKFTALAKKYYDKAMSVMDRMDDNSTLPADTEDVVVKYLEMQRVFEMAAGIIKYDAMFVANALRRYGDDIRKETLSEMVDFYSPLENWELFKSKLTKKMKSLNFSVSYTQNGLAYINREYDIIMFVDIDPDNPKFFSYKINSMKYPGNKILDSGKKDVGSYSVLELLDKIEMHTKKSMLEMSEKRQRWVIYLNGQPAAHYETKQEAQQIAELLLQNPKLKNTDVKIVSVSKDKLKESMNQEKNIMYVITHGQRQICSFSDEEEAKEYCRFLRRKTKDKSYQVIEVEYPKEKYGVM